MPPGGGDLPPGPGGDPPPPRQRAKIKLADGKARTIQHIMMTSFWYPNGTPMSSQQFLDLLCGKLPEFFQNEDELRTLWSEPETRKSCSKASWRKV